MTTTATPVYGTSTAITMTLASLASDTNLLAGRESTAVDNTSDLAIDDVVGGKIKTGTTTAGRQIEVWVIGSYDGTSYSAGATGSDANLSIVSTDKVLMKLLQIIPIPDTAARTYTWGPFSVANAFGGTMPKKWSIYIVQNSGAALDATGGNHEVKYTPVKYQSA